MASAAAASKESGGGGGKEERCQCWSRRGAGVEWRLSGAGQA
jgi:hypothetical protein